MLGIRGSKEVEMGARVPENMQHAAEEVWRFGQGVTGPQEPGALEKWLSLEGKPQESMETNKKPTIFQLGLTLPLSPCRQDPTVLVSQETHT